MPNHAAGAVRHDTSLMCLVIVSYFGADCKRAAKEPRRKKLRRGSDIRLAGNQSGLAGSDQAHLVDLVRVAAAGQVVDGSVQALQDGAVSSIAAQTLCDLIADVAGLDAGEDKGVGLASDLAALALDLSDLGTW